MGSSGEPPVQEEVGHVIQEVLQVQGVEPAALVLGVGVEAHGAMIP